MFKFWNYYVLKLLRLETIMFSDATLSDINVVLSYGLLQHHFFGFLHSREYLFSSTEKTSTTLTAELGQQN